jgi:threonine/homoserine/homoserine lactone efflux protein
LPTHSLPAILIFAYLIGFSGAASPGPVSAAIVSQSSRLGWTVGPLVSVGHAFLELLMAILVGFGLASGLANPNIQIAIAFIGGGLLLWMGVDMLLGSWRGKVRIPGIGADPQNMSKRQMLVMGMVTTVSNPFWYAWWVTVAAGYLAQARGLGVAAVGAFYLGHIGADFTWNTLLSTIIGSGKRWITDRVYRILIAICAAFLIYLGIVFLLQGLRMLV